MKLVKKLVLGAIALIIVLLGTGLYYIDHIAKTGVEVGATYALGTPTTVDNVDIGILSGSADLSELTVQNPQGFKTPHLFRMGYGSAAVSLGSLLGDTVEMPTLALSQVDMYLERRGGKSNYQVMLDSLQRLGSESPDEPAKSGKRFVIRKAAIDNVSVTVELLPAGGELTRMPVTIERIELNNIGSDSDGGVLMSELSGILMDAILKAVLSKCGKILPADITNELNQSLASIGYLGTGAVEVVGEVNATVDGQLVNLQGAGTELLEGLSKEGQKLGDDLNKEIGKVLGGKKKSEESEE